MFDKKRCSTSAPALLQRLSRPLLSGCCALLAVSFCLATPLFAYKPLLIGPESDTGDLGQLAIKALKSSLNNIHDRPVYVSEVFDAISQKTGIPADQLRPQLHAHLEQLFTRHENKGLDWQVYLPKDRKRPNSEATGRFIKACLKQARKAVKKKKSTELGGVITNAAKKARISPYRGKVLLLDLLNTLRERDSTTFGSPPVFLGPFLPTYSPTRQDIPVNIAVDVLVDTSGQIEKTGPIAAGELYKEKIKKLVQKWNFTPALNREDTPIKSWIRIPLSFYPSGAVGINYAPSISRDDFESFVVNGPETRAIVVDFWAPWCGPCRALGPVLARIAQERSDELVLVKVNVDTNSKLSQQYSIRSIPHVKVFRKGREISQFTGYIGYSAIDRIFSQLSSNEKIGSSSR